MTGLRVGRGGGVACRRLSFEHDVSAACEGDIDVGKLVG